MADDGKDNKEVTENRGMRSIIAPMFGLCINYDLNCLTLNRVVAPRRGFVHRF